jgi:hypothetical protein
MPPVGFKPTIPASERPQTHALDRAATGIGDIIQYTSKITHLHTASALCLGRIRTPDSSITKQTCSNDRHLPHSDVAQDESSGYFVLFFGKYSPTFPSTLVPSSSGPSSQRRVESSRSCIFTSVYHCSQTFG